VPQRVSANQASVPRVFLCSTGHNLLTPESTEAGVALTGVAVDSLHTLTMAAAGCRGTGSCVTQGKLLFVASLIIPLARILVSLDVDLHTVFIGLLIVRFAWSPVLGFFGQKLLGPYPGPLLIDLSDSDPVVSWGIAEHGVQVLNFFLVLNRNQMRVPLLTVSTSFVKSHGFCGGIVRPGLTLFKQEKHKSENREKL